MTPVFTNDAIVLGILLLILAVIFKTASSKNENWQRFYTYVPSLLLCYFIPAICNYPLGLIAPHWYNEGLVEALVRANIQLPADFSNYSFEQVQTFLTERGLLLADYDQYTGHSKLYYVASRYLLPASLILLCLSIDMKSILGLGSKALIMFFTATLGIIIGGPIALWIGQSLFFDAINIPADELWRGLSTIAGSWIGGGANQTAMKEIYEVPDNLFASMIVGDVIVANIWMGFLLYGAGINKRIDRWLKADDSAIEELKDKVESYRASIERIPNVTDMFMLLAVSFVGVAIAHWCADNITPWLQEQHGESLANYKLNSLLSHFFWLIVVSTTIGVGLSFTKLRQLEGVGASKLGSVFIYILVATIGMKMNIGEMGNKWGLLLVCLIWISLHVIILLLVAKLLRAPFFFVAVGSQANIGGAASAPIVASAFHPSLASVGVLLAVLGYALGTYGAIVCAELMKSVVG